MNKEELGEMFAVKREKLGMSQQQVADLIGKSRGYIGQIERGLKMPGDEVFAQLAVVLQIPLASILPMEELKKSSPELAMLIELADQGFGSVGDMLSPQERMTLITSQQNNEARIESMIAAVGQVEIDPAPAGWGKLTKGDRKLVQEIINRLLKTKRYEGA